MNRFIRRTRSTPLIIALALILIGLFAVPAAGQTPAAASNAGRYIVVFNNNVQDVPGMAAQLAGQSHAQVEFVYQHALKGFAGVIPAGRVAALQRNANVAYVEPDHVAHALAQTLPTGVDRIDADLNSTAAIDGSPTGVDVGVAVIDTGIDLTHPELNVVGSTNCTSRSPFGTTCVDGNGNDDNGHGSHVAGIIAARDNTSGVVGVAPGARLWAVKVLDRKGSGYFSWIIAGIDWVTAHSSEIEVANMSLGGQGSSTAMHQAIQNAVDAGVIFVVSAGNDAEDVYGPDGTYGTSDDFTPAAYPEVMTVSALADYDGKAGGLGGSGTYGVDDTLASFSNFSRSVVAGNPVDSAGKAIDVAGPGVSIYSTYKNGGYATMSGTSMASPHVAGAVALYVAAHGRADNASGVYSIRQALIDSGEPQSTWRSGSTADPDGNKEPLVYVGDDATPPPSNQPPVASFTFNCTDLSCSFDASGSSDQDGSIVSYSWDFGDGDTALGASPTHTYVAEGTYDVELTVTDNAAATDTATQSVTVTAPVPNQSPTASFTFNCDGLTCSFDASGSSDPDGTIVSYAWDFGDGSTGSGTTANHSYASAESYDVTLTVTDNGDATDSITHVATATEPQPGREMHVADMIDASQVAGRNWKPGVAVTITYADDEQPVYNATVYVHYEYTGDNSSGDLSCVTDSSGTCTVVASPTKKASQATFTVTSVDYRVDYFTEENNSITIDNPR